MFSRNTVSVAEKWWKVSSLVRTTQLENVLSPDTVHKLFIYFHVWASLCKQKQVHTEKEQGVHRMTAIWWPCFEPLLDTITHVHVSDRRLTPVPTIVWRSSKTKNCKTPEHEVNINRIWECMQNLDTHSFIIAAPQRLKTCTMWRLRKLGSIPPLYQMYCALKSRLSKHKNCIEER